MEVGEDAVEFNETRKKNSPDSDRDPQGEMLRVIGCYRMICTRFFKSDAFWPGF